MGKGVHFMFEVVSKPKFSKEHDPADCIIKKWPKVLFPGVLPFLGYKIVFHYSVANYDHFGEYLYVFSHKDTQ